MNRPLVHHIDQGHKMTIVFRMYRLHNMDYQKYENVNFVIPLYLSKLNKSLLFWFPSRTEILTSQATIIFCIKRLTLIFILFYFLLNPCRYLHGNKITTLPGYMLAGTGIEFL